jgi:predicted alpha/beta hydrolase family esterase
VPRGLPPFPSIVTAGTGDPLGVSQRVAELARGWGGLDPDSGHGEWPLAEELLAQLESDPASAVSDAAPAGGRV